MTGDNHGNIVAFSSKIAVEQAGDQTGMSPGKPGIIVLIPVSLYTVGMHHQDVSMHPWLRKFPNPWHTGSKCPIVAAETFRLPIVQEAHRNIANSGCRHALFRWTKLYNGSRSASRLSKSLINQLKCGCHSCGRLRAKDGDSFTSSLFGEWAASQTIYDHRTQNSRPFDNFPRITADFLPLNGNADPAAFESVRRGAIVRSAQPRPNHGSTPRLTEHLETVRKTFDRAKASTGSAGG